MAETDDHRQDTSRAEELVQQWLEGTLTPAGAEELLSLLKRNSSLPGWMLAQLNIDQMLQQLLDVPPQDIGDEGHDSSARSKPVRRYFRKGLLATGLSLGLCLGFWCLRPVLRSKPGLEDAKQIAGEAGQEISSGSASVEISAEPTTDAVAVVSQSLSAAKGEQEWSLGVGTVLSPGSYRLRSGLVGIDFFNGTRVALQGPCEFEIVSGNRISCLSGRLYAALTGTIREFQIDTPHGEISEAGQQTGVFVTPEQTWVHVFQGQVRLDQFRNRRVQQGEALAFTRQKIQKLMTADEKQFVSVQMLDERYARALQVCTADWKAFGKKLNADPSLLVRFEFSDSATESGHLLRNQSLFSPVRTGTIVGCRTINGHGAVPHVLAFQNLSDRVCLDVPDVLSTMTMTLWVRVHSLPHKLSGLFMSDGESIGGLHWQLTYRRQVRLCYLNFSHWDPRCELDSPVIPEEKMINRWLHLAVTLDMEHQWAAQYLNGELLNEGFLLMEHGIRINQASLGNWANPGDHHTPIRNLHGDLAELTLHNRLLAPKEIREIYRAGISNNMMDPAISLPIDDGKSPNSIETKKNVSVLRHSHQ